MSEGIVIALIGAFATVLAELVKSLIEAYTPKVQPPDAESQSQGADSRSGAPPEKPRPNRKRLAALTLLLLICAGFGAAVFWRYFTLKSSLPVYAVLYDDGSLVFQHGDQVDILKLLAERKEVYLVDMENGYQWEEDRPTTPWHSEREFIQEVVFADAIRPKSTAYWFWGFRNMKSVKGAFHLDTSNVKNMSYMFYNCNTLKKLDVSHLDTSNVTDMSYMFAALEAENHFTELDVSTFKTDEVKTMCAMFQNCANLETLDLSGFNTENVTDMSHMFNGCKSLTELNISRFDTSNVTNMYAMFYNCNNLIELDIRRFNTSNVTDMRFMFAASEAGNHFAKLDVSGFKTDKVTNMSAMFQHSANLTALDLSGFNTENVADMRWMFSGCEALSAIYVSDQFTTSQAAESQYMFSHCLSLKGDKGTSYNENRLDKTYARIDGGVSSPGYFSAKG